MKRTRRIALVAAAVVLAGVVSISLTRLAPPRAETPAATVSILPAGPGRIVAITNSPEEIFRRAFWRHPAAADRIVHGDRREWSEKGGEVERWQWFLQVQPSPELLRALRDPDTFGLRPASAPPAADRATAPDWFPTPAQLADCELLQGPSGGLTVYYRSAGNVLFATDAGPGFAPPVTAPLASR